MASESQIELYEKLYFHEIEVRENLNGRLQLPMAIIVSLAGVLGYLIQNVDDRQFSASLAIFTITIFLSSVTLLTAIFFFVRSWFNHTYAFFPSAKDTEEYRNLLASTYLGFEDGKQLANQYFEEYIQNNFINCSTQNTQCNDIRSLNLHKTNGTLIIATILVFASFTFFALGKLDQAKNGKPTEIVISKPIELSNSNSTNSLLTPHHITCDCLGIEKCFTTPKERSNDKSKATNTAATATAASAKADSGRRRNCEKEIGGK
ncbi:MAG: hypothetical protein ABII81_11805 [Pseudomonadota bacterium]